MTRPHYSSRSGAARLSGQAYRGVSSQKPSKKPELPLVPVSDGLVECPTCHGGVKLVNPLAEPRAGHKLYGSHKHGGSPSRGWTNRCPKSLEVYDG